MNSSDYWHEREEESRKNHIKEEREYQKEVDRIYKQMMDSISDQIYAFYAKYATEKGLTMSEVKKKCSKLDMEQFSRKAKEYIKNKDFSENANDEMKLYNLTMKVNRLLLLQANIGLELVDGHDKLEKFYKEKLEGRTIEEIERQAGILGITIQDNKKLVNSIVNASFYNARFSDRVWMYQDLLKADLDKILKTALIQGRNPREFISQIRKKFNSTSSQAFRLLVTELARVQTDAQMKSYIKNGFEEYEFISLGNACDICKALDGKHFKVEKSSPGDNMPPMHPHCRCSTAPYMDEKEYYDWLDGYKQHGLNFAEWKKFDKYDRDRINHAYTIPKNKITKYLLKEGSAHFLEFYDVGYSIDDYKHLENDIINEFVHQKSFDRKGESQYYKGKYSIRMDLGVTHKRTFRVIWKILQDGTSQLVTAYRDKSLDRGDDDV